MPLQPLNPVLSDGQKLATLKRFRARYAEELAQLEVDIQEIMTNLAEAEFLAQYLGEQPEVQELRARKPDLESKEKRRQYLGKLLDRLDQSIPDQPAVAMPSPSGSQKVSNRRF